MRILMVHNFHRGRGGSDDSVIATQQLLVGKGHVVKLFARDSRDLPDTIRGRSSAALKGVYSWRAGRDMHIAITTFKPDVVHIHEIYPLLSHSVLQACRRARTPVVMTCHDYRLTCPVATHYNGERVCTSCLTRDRFECVRQNCRGRRTESAAFALRSAATARREAVRGSVHVYVTATEFAKGWLVNNAQLPADSIVVAPYVIPLPFTSSDPARGKYVAFAGRFVKEKGVDTLLAAGRLTGIPLQLAGGDCRAAGDSGESRAVFRGVLGQDDLRSFYRGARALVVPSEWFETFGIVAGEGMSHGVPVIASAIGALREVVLDGETGLLFRAGDPEDLGEKMSRLWRDPSLARSLGAAGRLRISQLCSPANHLDRVLEAYQLARRLASQV